MEKPLSSPVPGSEFLISLCGDDGIEFNGKRYVPDPTKGFFQFKLSHAFPVATMWQTALYPAVIAKSYRSLENQMLDFEHQISAYHRESGKDVRDRVVGGIVAVDFPQGPMGGWQVDKNPDNSPAITGVAVVWKQTQGMADVLGLHLTGRRKYGVSMEVLWLLEESGFAVELPQAISTANGVRPAGYADPATGDTPNDLLAAGYEYIPYDKAPPELVATYSPSQRRIVARYQGRKVFVLMGGLNNPVHYAGVGVVHNQAEKPAAIMRLAASAEDPQFEVMLKAANTLDTAFSPKRTV